MLQRQQIDPQCLLKSGLSGKRMHASHTVAKAAAHVRKLRDCAAHHEGGDDGLHRGGQQAFDYGLQAITEGQARGMGILPEFCADKPAYSSPWHYHECSMQIGVVLGGSVELGFAPDNISRLTTGDIMLIPGGVVHSVGNPSADYATVEFTFPGSFGTAEAPEPRYAPGERCQAQMLSASQALRVDSHRGLVRYAYPVCPPHNRTYRLVREWRSRVVDFSPGEFDSTEGLLLLLVLSGWREIALDGRTERLEPCDLLVLGEGATCADLDASEGHEALVIKVAGDLGADDLSVRSESNQDG